MCVREGQIFSARRLENRIDPALEPMSHTGPEDALAPELEGKKIQLKNNRTPLSASPDKAFRQ